uniref:Genome polyprotein n=1 Tax=Pepper mottle virus TaxID=12209 RepID=C7S7E5_PEMV|nr:polyprotein precursor [Pepper mottle virus]
MAINVIQFGSFVCNLPKFQSSCTTMHCPKQSISTNVVHPSNPFAELEERLEPYLQRRMDATIRLTRGGTLVYKHMSEARRAKKLRKKQREEEEVYLFMNAAPYIVSNITIGGGVAPSKMEEVSIKRPLNKTPSQKVKKSFTPVTFRDGHMEKFLRGLKNCATRNNMTVHLIGKRKTELAFKRRASSDAVYATLHHMRGVDRKCDIVLEEWMNEYVHNLSRVGTWGSLFHAESLKRGDSGLILNARALRGKFGRCSRGFFIVRGKSDGVVLDARSKLSMATVLHMEQYSTPEAFWSGLEKKWSVMRKSTAHTCKPTYSVSNCGEVAAIIAQALFPCHKLTCGECSKEICDLTSSECVQELHKNISLALERMNNLHPEFQHIVKVLSVVRQLTEASNHGMEVFDEIFKMIGSKTQSPFTHLNKLNEFMLKGNENTSEEWSTARQHLKELVRFQKNRTDNIKKGDLASFRNKLSARAQYNLYLSCDNQLDKNASFLWGQREYHARRFFLNFFQQIDPSKGYLSYEDRTIPNGSRKLAIGNLIVPLDLAEFRKRMKGIDTQQPPIGKYCTSQLDGNFVYPCCCTTLDDGQPIRSAVYAPTKRHLVVGNTGDTKYINLPKGDTEMLYIALDGYCYINIYLAMLVNISEEEAKDFTKKVRDIFMPKLGKWPTLMDLATTCAQLRIFHPDVHDAELPRILVDHNTQTCHVVDSYGSISTGYHILKAATVSQLVLFADDNLESEIKHYRVGGTVENHKVKIDDQPSRCGVSEFHAIRMLIKGIYRPSVMYELLSEEPYLLVFSILSPSILIAMYNDRAFELAVQIWLEKEQSIPLIATILTNLAAKVSVATTLVQQLQLIELSADQLLNVTCDGFRVSFAYQSALTLLTRMRDQAKANSELISGGFNEYDQDLAWTLEKNYQGLLHDQWKELSSLEKFRYYWSSRKRKTRLRSNIKSRSSPVASAISSLSPKPFMGKVFSHMKAGAVRTKQGTKSFIDARCLGISTYFVGSLMRKFPSAKVLLSSLFVLGALLNITHAANRIIIDNRISREHAAALELYRKEDTCHELYTALERKLGEKPTWDEYCSYVAKINPAMLEFIKDSYDEKQVIHQRSTEDLKKVEHIIAFVTLAIMLFDSERSDCVFKTLNKFKGVVCSLGSEVRHQSLDDFVNTMDEKNFVVDFELNDSVQRKNLTTEITFENWWDEQVARGFTIPHYRTEGRFMEFTRATAAKVASDISISSERDFLIRGAVGSGKSTGLPHHLSTYGRVLLIEPTRPLAENVFKQLSGGPFFLKPTMRMRGNSVFGSSPISVMTSGFALHFFANNITQLQEIQFIIIDECHVMDASSMAFRSLIHTYHTNCKVLKVSATPPGREVEFTTQFPVKLVVEDSLSFKTFVESQGTGSNCDMIQYGNNLLVYVASYNEVDQLSKLLVAREFNVTKVDGRTMKHGELEIVTRGTKNKPHFVVATNIIENGVTLDIDVVIDFGMKVSPFLDVDNRSVAYNKVSISYGERIQRLGRVGRIQKGTALRIGHTEKGLIEIPQMISTEAALYCFAYNLPVMSSGVSTSMIKNCTIPQVRTMHTFELSPFFMYNFVSHDGTMHPVVHEILKRYKLRDSVIPLSESSIPYRASSDWITAGDYRRIGVKLDIPDETRIAFHIKDIPPQIHQQLWESVLKYKASAAFPTLRSSSITKIAYTLSTDLYAIPRTLAVVESLLEDERTKQYQFKSLIDNGCSSMFSVVGISNALRAKYSKDYTVENINKLEAVKAQLKEFHNLNGSGDELNLIKRFESLQFVHHQSKSSLAKALGLRGVWNKSLIVRDAIIAAGVACGGAWLLYTWFTGKMSEVSHQGRSKTKRIQALKFRKARDKRAGFEIDNNEDTIEEYFGSAYTKKGKGKGTTVGMGKTNRRFINMYGFEPGQFSYIKFVDPLTGAQMEENVYADIVDVQDKFGEIRKQMIIDDELDNRQTEVHNTIHAYLIKDWSNKALKVDLTPHNPLRVSDKASAIMKFPEREGELRQTGQAVEVDVSDIPKEVVKHEAKTLMRGLRDYNPIAQTVCKLTVKSELGETSTYGLGFGGLIIANHHLFKSFNGSLEVKSHHGVFRVPNLMAISVLPLKGRDMIIIKMPKDFPVFPQRLKFREPASTGRVCLIGSNFQERYISTTVSEISATHPVPRSTFWKHWISTDDGHCGLPIVSTTDGFILGLHSLANNRNSENYYTAFDSDFEMKVLRSGENTEWVKNWKYNPDTVLWGPLQLTKGTPSGMFKTTKMIEDLLAFKSESVREQAHTSPWMLEVLKENLKAVAYMKSQLVTKHVVKGECMMFKQYLQENPRANEFFQPKMWAYGKSMLNKEAYIKDIMKYSKVIDVGVVDCDAFEEAIIRVIVYMQIHGFRKCSYITDEEEIFKALNMNTAVGAMYGGKKKEYFEKFTTEDKAEILRQSCLRLYTGKLGVWNGSLKAELRSKEKIEANKTRTFTAAPIDTLLGGKVCVDDFNNQFYSKNIECCWTVGMTKFYGGWNKLLTALPDGWIYCDADGSQFDSSLTPYLINAVLTIRYAFMEDWDIGYKMLQNLYTEIIYTPVSTPDGTIVKKFRGNNSGQPSTVVDNSLMVVLAMHYAFVREGVVFEEIDSICKFFVNGDDLLIAVNPERENLLDTLSSHFSDLGLNYDFSSRTRDKSELWFMSHCGISVEGMYIPKLEEERIVSILQWDRAELPEYRLEAICAAMIESWGYPQLTHEIRRFYSWLIEKNPYADLASEGKAPYISELALKKLYLNQDVQNDELQVYLRYFAEADEEFECGTYEVHHQSSSRPDTLDAGEEKKKNKEVATVSDGMKKKEVESTRDSDVNAGTVGTFTVPRIKSITEKMRMPKQKKKGVLNLAHLLEYKPSQVDISNTRSTQAQFDNWYSEVMKAYDLQEEAMGTVMNGLMVWCIENGTSPNISGTWTMMDGDEQVEFPLKPVIENAKPTFRQIMAHFSDVAEAYIEMRNKQEPYMPRYGLVRNLRDMGLARYAFDFYEVTSRTSTRAREAHIQMKAAALKSAQTRLFGLDGGIGTQGENTERHTTEDVSPDMHTLLGVRNM